MENQLVSDMCCWELYPNSFIDIITDTAANMNSLGREIEERWNTTYSGHVYCADHTLQLTAVLAFFGIVSVESYGEDTSVGCLKKTRDLVLHIQSVSPFGQDRKNRSRSQPLALFRISHFESRPDCLPYHSP
jgi:hypothetical protein